MMDTQLIVARKIVVFSQLDYEPARLLVASLQSTNLFDVVSVDKLEGDLEVFKNSDTVVMFIAPKDFPKTMYQTNFLVRMAQELKIFNLVWVAPIAASGCGLEQALSTAAKVIEEQSINSLVVRHATIFADLLNFSKIRGRKKWAYFPVGYAIALTSILYSVFPNLVANIS